MISRHINKSLINSLLQGLVFILFLYSGFTKVLRFDLFVNNLDKSVFLEQLNTHVIAILIISIEFLIPALLLFRSTLNAGYQISFFLLLIFTGYILLILNFSPYIPCSCGGLIEYLSWKQHIVFNCVFLLILLYLIFSGKKNNPKPA